MIRRGFFILILTTLLGASTKPGAFGGGSRIR